MFGISCYNSIFLRIFQKAIIYCKWLLTMQLQLSYHKFLSKEHYRVYSLWSAIPHCGRGSIVRGVGIY